MSKYFLSRAVLATILAALMLAFGMVWWGAGLAGLLIFATFVAAARSGRYLVEPGGGLAPMRRDELSQEINRRAGLNGFIVLILAIAGLALYYGMIAHSSVPVPMLDSVLLLGLAVYIFTDYRLRKL